MFLYAYYVPIDFDIIIFTYTYEYIYINIHENSLTSCIANLAVANKTQVHGQRGMAHSAVREAQLARMPFPCFVGREKSGGHLPSLVKRHTHPSMVYLTT